MKREWRLDVLRGVAILLVLLQHCKRDWYAGTVVGFFLGPIKHCGWSGVDLFFVLSGFLISGLLFREYQRYGTVSVGRFLIRRGFKIYPTYYIWLAVSCAGAYAYHQPATAREILFSIFYLQTYFNANRFEISWSLCIEEQFYFIMAFAVAWAVARRRDGNAFAGFPLIAVVLGIVPMLLRVQMVLSHPDVTALTRKMVFHLRYDQLLVGVLIGYYYTFQRERLTVFVQRWRWAIGLGSILLLAIRFSERLPLVWWYGPGYTMLGLAYGGILLLTATAPPPEGTSPRPIWALLAALGRISYSVYLFHIVALSVTLRLAGRPILHRLPAELRTWSILIFYLGLAIAVSVAAWWLIERPALAMRDRLYPSRVGAIAAVEAAAAAAQAAPETPPAVDEPAEPAP